MYTCWDGDWFRDFVCIPVGTVTVLWTVYVFLLGRWLFCVLCMYSCWDGDCFVDCVCIPVGGGDYFSFSFYILCCLTEGDVCACACT